jgi:DNA-binding protein H-NS
MRTRKKRDRERFRAQEVAAPYGTTVDEFFAPRGTRRERAKLTYRNPENPKQTWSGRGKQPSWVKEALKSGVTIEALQVK